MRGEDIQQHDLFSYGSLEQRVPADHPLRPIRTMVHEALKSLDGRFEEIYEEDGRKSIPPERLLRALLLQMGIEQWAPDCRIVYDKFHVMQHANRAVDEVRRAEFFRKGGRMRGVVKG